MKLDVEPDIYAMSSVSFGDRPAGNIAIVALRKTAEMGKNEFPDACNVVLKNTYVDDIVDCVKDQQTAVKLTKDIDELLKPGGFTIKRWYYSTRCTEENENQMGTNDVPSNVMGEIQVNQNKGEIQRVLGMIWDADLDIFKFDVHLNFSPKHRTLRTGPDLKLEDLTTEIPLTKRMILSQINAIYDPLGLAGPFIVRAKILMRQLWGMKSLSWDDVIPEIYKKGWIAFFKDMFVMKDISFSRCIRPTNVRGNPSLVVFGDGSNDAFGACAYVRWKKTDGTFESHLIASKNRITPLHRMTTVRSELCGAVMVKRLKVFIQDEMRYKFDKEYFILDSQIVRAMVQKESYGFNTFVAVRIGEIQEKTDPRNWY